ncbi:Uncharacterised protein [Enterobacter cancerogenus]|uniref:Uncharacterized protein n=1 Tax=Enterobacter cancerogenus TaxID=69218 RepID=A0A484WZS6_9ENTR|nr:Uncharacterised protein [Enterobacter cancerogenus]
MPVNNCFPLIDVFPSMFNIVTPLTSGTSRLNCAGGFL